MFQRLRQSLTDDDRGYFNIKESLKITWNLTSTPLQSGFFSYSWSIQFHLQYKNCKISETGKRKGQLIKYKLLALFLLLKKLSWSQPVQLTLQSSSGSEGERGTGLLGQLGGDKGHTLLTPWLLWVLLYYPCQDWGQHTPAHIRAVVLMPHVLH